MDFPKIKKKVSDFLLGEEGKISKKSMLKLGSLLTLAALITVSQDDKVMMAEGGGHDSHGSHASHASHNEALHNNSLNFDYGGGTATSTHNHCYGVPNVCHNNY